jgi:hypothetical protein
MMHVAVGRQWMSCGQSVRFTRVIRPRQTTRLQGVHTDALPVRTTTLVYAGKHRLYPQSTALITDISFHTSDRCNHHPRARPQL